jgi:hypothetical protein
VNRKVGKFKLWQLILVGVAIGGAVYLYRRKTVANPEEASGGTGTGAFGPIDPNSGIPYAFESGAGTVSPGETLNSFLEKVAQLRDSGFFGSPEKEPGEVVEIPGAEPASNQAVTQAQAAARKARKKAKEAHKALVEEKRARHKAEHQHTQKPKKTGAAASVPHTHVGQAHPAQRAGQAKHSGGGGGGGGGGQPQRHWVSGHWAGSGKGRHYVEGHWA